MSIKKNFIASYISQIYVSVVGILILPLYIKYLGAEAYGLVGFFTMMQAWFALLDLGLTPTIARETARYHGGTITALHYRQLYRIMNAFFIVIGVIGGFVLLLTAEAIAQKWLQVASLDMSVVVSAVQIMAISVALRWIGGFYRGVITGSERLIWLSYFNAIVATMRFPAVFITMLFCGFTPIVFFVHQLFIAIFEMLILYFMSSKLKPKITDFSHIGWHTESVKPVLKFALTIAFTSSVWVLVTQTDKLILSGILSLAEYGYFTLAVLVASGIMILSAPVSSVIMPRMARLHAECKHSEMIELYRNATQLVSVIAGTASLTIAFFSEEIIFTWTGDRDIALKTASILSLYALGNGVLVVSAFPYYLQYALGNLRYHLVGNFITILLLVPTVIWAASHYGGIGAGWAWLGINSLYLLLWVGFVHHKLASGLHKSWIIKDIMVIYIPIIIFYAILNYYSLEYETRLESFYGIASFSFLAAVIAVSSSSVARRLVFKKLFGATL
jgi:O-antigen/teichoic acid export membrane protein